MGGTSNGSRIKELIRLGFVEAGHWILHNSKPCVRLNDHRVICPALYALVRDDVVVYVGKSIRTLQHRMRQYERPGKTQRTSQRNHKDIGLALQSGSRIRVFVLRLDTPIKYRGLTINLAAGLEDPLIALFSPAWNKTGKA